MAKRNSEETKAKQDIVDIPVPQEELLPDDKTVEEEEVETGIPKEDILPDPDNEERVEEIVEVETPKESEEDKEKRYRAQQAEDSIIREKDRELKAKIEEASKIADPTEDELKTEYSEWDEMTSTEKRLAKDNLGNKRKLSLINEANTEALKIDDWGKSIDGLLEKIDSDASLLPLSGHELEFRRYAMQASHRNVDTEVLIPAFLHTLGNEVKPNRSIFNSKGGGIAPEKPKSDIITDADEARRLKTGTQAQQDEYRRKLRAGKIRIEVE